MGAFKSPALGYGLLPHCNTDNCAYPVGKVQEDNPLGPGDDDDDDDYLRLQHGKGFHNLVYMFYVKHTNPASKT
jgi:hypothetical protein